MDDNNTAFSNKRRSRKTGNIIPENESYFSQRNISSCNNNKSVTGEYCERLSQWIYQCYYYNMMNTWSIMMTQSLAIQQQLQPNVGQTTDNNTQNNITNESGRIYCIPKLWKRAAAEVIDFFFLLILKLMVTYFAIDYLDMIDVDKFDLSVLESNTFDPVQLAYELTSEIIIIEMIHRLVVCAYETICLYRGQLNRPGGSTPGKAIFGIVVVSCDRIDEIGHGLIRVIPANNIGLFRSLLRALIKNLSAVFFIPASFTVFFISYNRAAYDILCKCIVVEEVLAGNRLRPRTN